MSSATGLTPDEVTLHVTWKVEVIALSVCVAIFGGYTTIQLFEQLREATTRSMKQLWAALASFGLGTCTVWGMHFIGMLAVDLGIEVHYEVSFTILSLLGVIIAARLGISIAFHEWLTPGFQVSRLTGDNLDAVESLEKGEQYVMTNSKTHLSHATSVLTSHRTSLHGDALHQQRNRFDFFRRWLLDLLSERGHVTYARLIAGGSTIGAGVVLMHYTGMAAMTAPGLVMQWRWGVVAASCIIAVTVAIAGLFIFDRFNGFIWNIISSCVIAAAVLTMHYVSMHAVIFKIRYPITGSHRTPAIPQDGLALLIALGIFSTSFILVGAVAAVTERTRRQLDVLVAAKTAELRINVENSNRLLHNIFPSEVIHHFNETARQDSSPGEALDITGIHYSQEHSSVTIIFVDIVGFTNMCSDMNASEIVLFLDTFFSMFDRLCMRMGVEKIKTIGDAYLAVAGIHKTDDKKKRIKGNTGNEHVMQAFKTAQEMQVLAREYATSHPERKFSIRIGLHTGPVVAGVICQTRFAFDIWGNTVNVASRMESLAQPGTIMCSHQVYKALVSADPTLGAFKATQSDVKGCGLMTTYQYPATVPVDDDGISPSVSSSSVQNSDTPLLGRTTPPPGLVSES